MPAKVVAPTSSTAPRMFLESRNIPELQKLIDQPKADGIARIKGADVSLSVVLFLAVTHRALWVAGKTQEASRIAHLGLPGLSRAINCLGHTGPNYCPKPFGEPSFDLYRISSKDDVSNDAWLMFLDRFRRSGSGGRTGQMFVSIASVLAEMGDNVACHAFEAKDKPCPAIAGFHVANGSATFCVADAGQGFLRSLHRSPLWSGLKTDHDALDAVVRKRATSRPDAKEGGGFKQLFNSLLDYHGLVILRSGTCAFHITNKNANRDQHTLHYANVPGSAVTTVISQRGQPAELPLENIS